MHNEIERSWNNLISLFFLDWKQRSQGEEGGLLVDSGFSGHVIRQNLKKKFGIIKSHHST